MNLRSILPFALILVASSLHAGGRHRAADPRSGCTLALAPRALAFPAAGGSATVVVSATGRCLWSSRASDAWISTSDTAQGVVVTVTPSTSALPRNGAIDIGGFAVTVTQDAFTPTIPNLVQNGTFDRDLTGWSTLYSTGTGTAVWTSSDANGAPSSGAARITSTQASLPGAAAGYQIVQCIAVKRSTRYESGVKVLIPPGQDANGVVTVGVYEYGVPNCDVTTGYLASHQQFLHTAATWTEVSDTYLLQGTTQSVLYVLGLGGARTPPYAASFDDAYVREK